MLREIEEAIAIKLESPLQQLGVRVRVTPDNGNGDRVNTRGILVIGYTGSSFSSVNQKTINNQQRILEYELSLSYKDLQTHKDNYEIIQTILDLLTGFQPIDCDSFYGALYPTRDGFVNNSEGFWRYSMTFALVVDHPILEHTYG